MTTCKSCNAEIRWVWTARDKRMPIDAEPREDGNLEINGVNEDGEPLIRYLVGQEETLPGLETPDRFVSHFANLPVSRQTSAQGRGPMSACPTCGVDTRWVETQNGDPILLDRQPIEDGGYALMAGRDEDGEATLLAVPIAATIPLLFGDNGATYRPHTCSTDKAAA